MQHDEAVEQVVVVADGVGDLRPPGAADAGRVQQRRELQRPVPDVLRVGARRRPQAVDGDLGPVLDGA